MSGPGENIPDPATRRPGAPLPRPRPYPKVGAGRPGDGAAREWGRRVGARLTGMVVLLCLLAAPVFAQEPGSVEMVRTDDAATGWEPWRLAMVKAATYRALASIDLVVGGYLLTGSEIETATIVAVVAGAKTVAYYLHELAWTYYGPAPDDMEPVDRSLAKSVTYRITSMSTVFALSLLFVDSIEMSAAVVTVDAVYGMGVYFLHEMLWNHYGPPVLPRGVGPVPVAG